MRLTAEQAQQVDNEVGQYVESLASEMYNLRARSPREMTPERWATICQKFPGSARQCRVDVYRLHAEDIESYRATLILEASGATSC